MIQNIFTKRTIVTDTIYFFIYTKKDLERIILFTSFLSLSYPPFVFDGYKVHVEVMVNLVDHDLSRDLALLDYLRRIYCLFCYPCLLVVHT